MIPSQIGIRDSEFGNPADTDAADEMDLKHEGHGKNVLVKRTHDEEAAVVRPVDRRQPYHRLSKGCPAGEFA